MGKTKKQRQKHRRHRQSHRSVQRKKGANEKPSTRPSGAVRQPANEKQDAKTKDVRTSELTKQEFRICYLCGREIPTKQQLDYTCLKCGNHACSSCIEVMDSLGDVCLTCDSRAKKRKAIWDTVALVVIIVVIIFIIWLIVISRFPGPAQTLYGNGGF